MNLMKGWQSGSQNTAIEQEKCRGKSGHNGEQAWLLKSVLYVQLLIQAHFSTQPFSLSKQL